jgi:hypothetical protein
MCVLNKDKTAGRNVPDLSVTGLVLDRAAEPHSEHALRAPCANQLDAYPPRCE